MKSRRVQYAFEIVGEIYTDSDDRVKGSIDSFLHAFLEDGTVWFLSADKSEWIQWELPDLPAIRGESL